MGKIGVIQYGLGPIGCAIAKLVCQREGLELVGAIDIDPAKVGRDVGELVGLGRPIGIAVSSDAASVLATGKAQVVLHSTVSSLEVAYHQVENIVIAGLNVISTCEELTFPQAQNAILAEEIDRLARYHGVTVLGTGVNPGFVMDTLALVMSGVCQRIEHIKVTRVVDAATRRLPLQKKIGAGLSVEEFRRLADSRAVRHVGLVESISLVARGLGWRLDKITETIEPIVSDSPVSSQFLRVEVGQVPMTSGQAAGVKQVCRGYIKGREFIALELQIYIGAKQPHDSIVIKGVPPINLTIEGGIAGDEATAAIVVNAIPRVLAAPPGLAHMTDLPIVSLWQALRP